VITSPGVSVFLGNRGCIARRHAALKLPSTCNVQAVLATSATMGVLLTVLYQSLQLLPQVLSSRDLVQ
jgi:hypothetical protein